MRGGVCAFYAGGPTLTRSNARDWRRGDGSLRDSAKIKSPNLLGLPSSVSFDSNGSLFVADTTNNRVQRFTISCRKIYLR